MIDVNRNDNAKAAVREFAEYVGQSDKCERYMEAFAPKRTVADAVEWAKTGWLHDDHDVIIFNGKHGLLYSKSECPLDDKEYLVCTRAEFEAYVKEQEGEKWTHVTNGDYKCKIISEYGDFLWVKVDCAGCPGTYKKSELKPIKPTISEVEAWRLVSERDMTPDEVKEKYEVV